MKLAVLLFIEFQNSLGLTCQEFSPAITKMCCGFLDWQGILSRSIIKVMIWEEVSLLNVVCFTFKSCLWSIGVCASVRVS